MEKVSLSIRVGEYSLEIDPDDVESFAFVLPCDVIDTGVTENGYVTRELGQGHLNLSINFKVGREPLWVREGE